MPAQAPRGQFANHAGIGVRAIERVWRNSNPMRSPRNEPTFRRPVFNGFFQLVGVTRDSSGTPLGLCTVRLFKADANDQLVAITASDVSGNFTFTVGTNEGNYWIEAYKPGSPDVAGTTLRTLTIP